MNKYLLLVLSLIVLASCSNAAPPPKVGECYIILDNVVRNMFHQVIKLVRVKDNEVSYAYTFLGDSNFKKGSWYATKGDENYLFTTLSIERLREEYKKVECPK